MTEARVWNRISYLKRMLKKTTKGEHQRQMLGHKCRENQKHAMGAQYPMKNRASMPRRGL